MGDPYRTAEVLTEETQEADEIYKEAKDIFEEGHGWSNANRTTALVASAILLHSKSIERAANVIATAIRESTVRGVTLPLAAPKRNIPTNSSEKLRGYQHGIIDKNPSMPRV